MSLRMHSPSPVASSSAPGKVVFPAPPPTMNSLTSEQRSQLLRKTKKLGQILGTTPHLMDDGITGALGPVHISLPYTTTLLPRISTDSFSSSSSSEELSFEILTPLSPDPSSSSQLPAPTTVTVPTRRRSLTRRGPSSASSSSPTSAKGKETPKNRPPFLRLTVAPAQSLETIPASPMAFPIASTARESDNAYPAGIGHGSTSSPILRASRSSLSTSSSVYPSSSSSSHASPSSAHPNENLSPSSAHPSPAPSRTHSRASSHGGVSIARAGSIESIHSRAASAESFYGERPTKYSLGSVEHPEGRGERMGPGHVELVRADEAQYVRREEARYVRHVPSEGAIRPKTSEGAHVRPKRNVRPKTSEGHVRPSPSDAFARHASDRRAAEAPAAILQSTPAPINPFAAPIISPSGRPLTPPLTIPTRPFAISAPARTHSLQAPARTLSLQAPVHPIPAPAPIHPHLLAPISLQAPPAGTSPPLTPSPPPSPSEMAVRVQKMERLRRKLGDGVPLEMVFPTGLPQQQGNPNISAPVLIEKPKDKAIPPPVSIPTAIARPVPVQKRMPLSSSRDSLELASTSTPRRRGRPEQLRPRPDTIRDGDELDEQQQDGDKHEPWYLSSPLHRHLQARVQPPAPPPKEKENTVLALGGWTAPFPAGASHFPTSIFSAFPSSQQTSVPNSAPAQGQRPSGTIVPVHIPASARAAAAPRSSSPQANQRLWAIMESPDEPAWGGVDARVKVWSTVSSVKSGSGSGSGSGSVTPIVSPLMTPLSMSPPMSPTTSMSPPRTPTTPRSMSYRKPPPAIIEC